MTVKKGDLVSVDYTGSFENGEVFDSSKHGDHSHPLEFVVGAGHVIPGFENAALGMNIGETKRVVIPAKEAYGEYDTRMTKEVPRAALPKDHEPKIGMTLAIAGPNGEELPVRIAKVSNTTVTLDFNHPLAGKALIFEITLVRVGPDAHPQHSHH
jgi:peptidylprolyl isomerase